MEACLYAVTALVEAGHEFGRHSWLHERPNTITRDGEARAPRKAFISSGVLPSDTARWHTLYPSTPDPPRIDGHL